jgi:hypothetical protein
MRESAPSPVPIALHQKPNSQLIAFGLASAPVSSVEGVILFPFAKKRMVTDNDGEVSMPAEAELTVCR